MKLAAKDMPNYSKELKKLSEKYDTIASKIEHHNPNGLGQHFTDVGELSKKISNHHYKAENAEKLRMLRATIMASFFELTTALKNSKSYLMHGEGFEGLGDMNVILKRHLVATLTPQEPKKEGLNLQNLVKEDPVLKAELMDIFLKKRTLKSLLI